MRNRKKIQATVRQTLSEGQNGYVAIEEEMEIFLPEDFQIHVDPTPKFGYVEESGNEKVEILHLKYVVNN